MSGKGHQEFIEKACESFKENDELALFAQNQMTQTVLQTNADLTTANRNLEKGVFSSSKFRAWLIGALVVLSVLMVLLYVSKYSQFNRLNLEQLMFSGEESAYKKRNSSLSDNDKFILYGDPSASSAVEAAKSRWLSDPKNAMYYVEYASAYDISYGHYPKDMIERGAELDPENSIYLVLEAGDLARKVVEQERKSRSSSRRSRRSRQPAKSNESRIEREGNSERPTAENSAAVAAKVLTQPRMVIKDQEGYDAALALILEAGKKSKCTEYMSERVKERVPLLTKKVENFIDHLSPLAYLARLSSRVLDVRMAIEIIKAETQRCALEKDAESLIKLISAHENICKQLGAEDNVTLIQALVVRAMIQGTTPYILDAVRACGLKELEKKYADLHARFERHNDFIETRVLVDTQDLRKYGSITASIISPLILSKVKDTSAIAPENHTPLRMVEHALIGRFSTVFLWVLFLSLAAIFALANVCKGRFVNVFSKKMLGVLGLADWLWVLGLGILAPLGVYYYFNNYTSLAVTQYNALHLEGTLTLIRPACLIIFLICSQTLVLEWRIAKVTDKLFGGKPARLVIAAFILGIVPFIILPFIAGSTSAPEKWFAVLGTSLFLLLVHGVVRFLPVLHSLKNSILSRAVVISFIMTSAALTLLFPLYKAQEQYWVARDEVIKVSPDRAGWTKLEGDVTKQFVKETRQLMGW